MEAAPQAHLHQALQTANIQTYAKVERFIQTALRECAYARAYDTSDQRAKDLPIWLQHYNWHRPHGSFEAKQPINRLGLPANDLLRLHS